MPAIVLGTAAAAPVAGAAADRLGARGPMIAGLALEALGLFLLSRAGATTSMPMLALALFAAGFGLGVFQVPNMALIMAAFGGAQQGVAGGFAFLARTLGVVTGVLGLAALFALRREIVGLAGAFGGAQQGVAGGFAFLVRTLGVVTGVLGLAALFAARRASVGAAPAFGEAFFAAAVAVGLAAVAAAARRRN